MRFSYCAAAALLAASAVANGQDYTLFMNDLEVTSGEAFSLPVQGTWASYVTGYSLSIGFPPSPPIDNLAFVVQGTLVGEIGPDFLQVNLVAAAGTLVVGMLFELTAPPFDGDALPPVNFPLAVGRIVGNVPSGTTPQPVPFDLVDGLGSPPISNILVVEVTTSIAPTLLHGAIVSIIDPPPPPPLPPEFMRGDANRDTHLDIGDILFVLNFAFAGGPPPGCLDAGDANDDGHADITDAVYLIYYLFVFGPAPPAPYPSMGPDPTFDFLDCLDA
ncbi:MAG: hypothetical protein AB7O52_12480 [Planctomycetota bacterium]